MLINEQIRAKEVLVIGPKGEQLGLKSREDALTLASVAGFDLVLMNANAEKPVCKLMDYNKYKYEKAKKIKASIRFRGREMAHTELGKDVLIRFADALKEFGAVEKQPTMEMRSMYMMIAPIKKEGK